jgi:hypothetical protein
VWLAKGYKTFQSAWRAIQRVWSSPLALVCYLRKNIFMAGRECHHCKQWIEQGAAHDCWTTTEVALTRDLSEDLREAWERLREIAAGFGQQRIYASGQAIMFARKTCYFFVRPKKQFLEVCVFLGRTIKASQVCRLDWVSKSKLVHVIRIRHRDEVEAPVTDWLSEAYQMSNALSKTDANLKTNPKPDKNAAVRAVENDQITEKRDPCIKGPAARSDDGTQLRRVRLICGSIPGTVEKMSHGEPTFFTPKRVFAMFANNHHGDGHVAVWVPAAPGVQADLIEEAPDIYFRPPYVGGAGWVGVELSRVDDERLGAVFREAFRLMTAKTIAIDRSESSRPTRPGKAPRRPRKT